MTNTITTRRPASEFDNTVFNLATNMTDAEYAGYVRGMFDCGCETCFGKLLYEETEMFLTEAENDKLYEFMLEDRKVQEQVESEQMQRFHAFLDSEEHIERVLRLTR